MLKLGFTETGEGRPVILLHGFPMNRAVWNSFSPGLSKNFRVIAIDLPGFGESSPIIKNAFSIDDAADAVLEFLHQKNLSQCVLAGHSLGGYVALSMIEKQPDDFSGLILFHSTALADSQEKKQSRTKVPEFIDRNSVETFTTNFITPLFADPDHPAIGIVREIARPSTAETVKAYTLAMRDRPDRTHVLRRFKKPILFLAGEKDGGIPVSSIRDQAAMNTNSEVSVLPGVAHMGMFENPEACLRKISAFATSCFSAS
jgi:pimeloyl-ACP methyl ester carboxylesterase